MFQFGILGKGAGKTRIRLFRKSKFLIFWERIITERAWERKKERKKDEVIRLFKIDMKDNITH